MCMRGGDILVGQGVKKVESISCSGGDGSGASKASRRQSRPRSGEKTRRAAN